MKYEKNQYSEGFSICALIIAGAFLWWGINQFIKWGDGGEWWGFVSTGIGVAILIGQILALTNRSKLRNVVQTEFQENPEVTVEDVSRITGITIRDIHAIVLDLKASGQLRAKFSSQTGQVKHLLPPKKEVTSEEQSKFCANCGTPITKESEQYCAYCGAKI